MSPAAPTPQPFSPALSISSIVRPQESAFAGKSPAPFHRTLHGSIASPFSTFQAEPNITISPPPLRYKQAEEENLRTRLSYAEVTFGFSHPITLDILAGLGQVLLEQGRYRSAETVLRRLVECCQSGRGFEDIKTLNALDLLGYALCHQGFYSKAERLHRRALKVKGDILGFQHPDTLIGMA